MKLFEYPSIVAHILVQEAHSIENIDGEFKAMQKYNLIIAIEGIDGAGKTTLITSLKQELGDRVCVYSRTQKGALANFLLNHFPLRDSHVLQIPFYLLLSYINCFKLQKREQASILIMDRCFLSNICYYYPTAMNNRLIFNLAMLFEVKLHPAEIFILDEDAVIAHKRDEMKKKLDWLVQTRSNYLKSPNSSTLTNYQINVIQRGLTPTAKKDIVIERLHELWRKK